MTLNPDFQKFLNNNKLNLPAKSIQAVLDLKADGATVPFMARYRKERTGNLDEVQIRNVVENFELWEELVKRKKFVLEEIEKQGNLTEELKKQINNSYDIGEVEELYRPFKRKKKTKAKLAREAGLEPFANWLLALGSGEVKDDTSLEVKAKEYLNPTAGFATYEETLRGAQHIIVEKLYTDIDLRAEVKEDYFANAIVISKPGKKLKPNTKFSQYLDYKESAKSLLSPKASHRYLAIRRGWQDSELTVTMESSDEKLLKSFVNKLIKDTANQATEFLKACAKAALTVHVIPSVANELHRLLKETADKHAIEVFSENVRRVLMSSPFGAKVVLGVDPGLKTGCKLALVNDSGKFISSTVLEILGDKAEEKAKSLFADVFKQIKIEVVAVGNGTGGREAESFIRKVLKELNIEAPVVLVNESGASVYSASDVAREEFPELDITVRGAISIARRLQDPLAELVKIEPKSIGVGQYQHDVSQSQLKKSLYNVVESCVNNVGVDLNTASSSLLQYVSGIGPATAENIIEFRNKSGKFTDREQLLKVGNFSSKTFEQAAGFLRVIDGDKPLDRTGIHPERYSAVREMASELGLKTSELMGEGAAKLESLKEKYSQLIGEYTFNDIIAELKKPGRDPRDPFKVFKFRDDIQEIKDLEKDMLCPGIVTNVTNFGAFVDIGVHQDGLVHLSQISHDFVDDPKKILSPGDQVQVKVLDVDKDKSQIALTMLLTEKPKSPAKAKSKKPQAKGKKFSKKTKGQKGKPRGKGKPGGLKPRRPAKPFNNPFAALSDINKK